MTLTQMTRTLATNVAKFSDLGCLPLPIDVEQLKKSGDMVESMVTNRAKWHKSCKYKFSNLKLERAEKRKSEEEPAGESAIKRSKITRKRSGAAPTKVKNTCFFCGKANGTLHQISTFNVDKRVRKCAIELEDIVLLAKLSAGDLISVAVYHVKCLASLYKTSHLLEQQTDKNDDKIIQGIGLAQLVEYIRRNTHRVRESPGVQTCGSCENVHKPFAAAWRRRVCSNPYN